MKNIYTMKNEEEALVKAATEAAEDYYECRYDDSHTGMRIAKEAFIYGAEWQKETTTVDKREE